MGSLNRCAFIGNLGSDPEVHHTASGDAVANFNIACNETWKDRDGNQQERTEWVRIVAWRKLGETCGQYLSKGRQVYVEGKLQTRKWQDQDGNDRYTTEIHADKVVFLGGQTGNQDGYGSSSNGGGGRGSAGRGQQAAGQYGGVGRGSSNESNYPGYSPEEDVPF